MFWDTYPTVPVSKVLEEYDYIVVGGGTAGCVIANRLSARPTTSVLVVERGGVKDGWISRVPLLSCHFVSDGSRSCVFRSTPQKHLGGRSLDLITGKSLGGGSKINSMLYTRGIPAEYNTWRDAGRAGWGYQDIEHYFARSEDDLDQDPRNVKPFHSVSGEWPNRSHKTPFWNHTARLEQATAALGIPYVEDMNDPAQPAYGCTKIHYSIDSSGRRSSTLTAFLPAPLARSRSNLHVCTRATVQRIHISSESSEVTAEGVWIESDEGGPARFVRAKREVILSSGPFASPQILMLSGIGPADHLKGHQLTVHKDLSGVGSRLQDHIGVPLQFQVTMEDTINQLQSRPWLIIVLFFQYLLFGIGWFLAPLPELSIFIQSRLLNEKYRVVKQEKQDLDATLPKNLPDVEIIPVANGDTKRITGGGFSLLTILLRPSSEGTVRLASTDPRANPVVDLNFFATEDDRKVMRAAVRFSLEIKKELAAQGYNIADGIVPGQTDEDIDDFIQKECMSAYHYSSTCRMAPESEGGVVDDRLRVHGVRKLRVADSSIFPSIPSTHLAAPTVAIAEKCAEMVEEDAFMFVRDSIIDKVVQEMAEERGKIAPPKTLDKATGNLSKGSSSMSNWGGETISYTTALKNKGSANTVGLIASAFVMLNRKTAAQNMTDTSASDHDADAEHLDSCSSLWYVLSSQTLIPAS